MPSPKSTTTASSSALGPLAAAIGIPLLPRAEKQSVTFWREALSAGELAARLKRWLLAGVELEADWPADEQRNRHVALGGTGLRDFSEGPGEASMDAIVAALR